MKLSDTTTSELNNQSNLLIFVHDFLSIWIKICWSENSFCYLSWVWERGNLFRLRQTKQIVREFRLEWNKICCCCCCCYWHCCYRCCCYSCMLLLNKLLLTVFLVLSLSCDIVKYVIIDTIAVVDLGVIVLKTDTRGWTFVWFW